MQFRPEEVARVQPAHREHDEQEQGGKNPGRAARATGYRGDSGDGGKGGHAGDVARLEATPQVPGKSAAGTTPARKIRGVNRADAATADQKSAA